MRRSLPIVPLAFLLLAPCGSAVAATVHLNDRTGNLIYRAAPGERNDLRIRAWQDEPSRGHEFASFLVEDSVPITTGRECRPAGGGPSSYFARCDLDVPSMGVRLRVILRDLNDRVRLSGSFPVEATVMGGPGHDHLTGNEGRNRLAGGLGSDLIAGRGGSDSIFAGRIGNDRDHTNDRLYGGDGSDELFGSRGDNVVDGGAAADVVYGRGGSDRIRARDGAVDQVICGKGADVTGNDPFDFLIRCERTRAASESPAVPLWLNVWPDSTGGTTADVLVGCLERHPESACTGSVQLELAGQPVSPEVEFTSASGHRQLVTFHPAPDVEPAHALDLAVRVRSRTAMGAPTDDAFPATELLLGFPFLG